MHLSTVSTLGLALAIDVMAPQQTAPNFERITQQTDKPINLSAPDIDRNHSMVAPISFPSRLPQDATWEAPVFSQTAKAPDDRMAPNRAFIRSIVEQEAKQVELPPDIAEAVVRVESGYDPNAIGRVGEIGLMQVRPGTAAMLGFHGNADELAKPEVNLHYGIKYLAEAWRLANGDLCRALMKYRAGHGEETMTPLSIDYCNRARGHLAALGSPFAAVGVSTLATPLFTTYDPKSSFSLISPTAVYKKFKKGTAAATRAFWSAEEARVRSIKAKLEAKWLHRIASR